MNIHSYKKLVLLLLVISFGLLGIATILGGGEAGRVSIMKILFTPTPLQIGLVQYASALLFLLLSLAALMGLTNMGLKHKASENKVLASYVDQLLGYGMLLVVIFPLLSLLAKLHWIDSLGGFPAIGSGQGIIKYFSLIGIALYFLRPTKLTAYQLAWANFLPVGLVLLWIGGMKFTAIEATGIDGLVRTSPLMGWLYHFFDVQTTSNIIGTYDLIGFMLLGLSLYQPKLFIPSSLMCLAVFLTTQSFLLTFPDSLSSRTVLTETGQFIIKDLWFIANLVIMAVMLKQSKACNG